MTGNDLVSHIAEETSATTATAAVQPRAFATHTRRRPRAGTPAFPLTLSQANRGARASHIAQAPGAFHRATDPIAAGARTLQLLGRLSQIRLSKPDTHFTEML